MPKKTLSIKSVLYKIFVISVVIYAILIAISIAATTYLFLNLPNYKTKIQDYIYKNTGYNLTIKNIDTGLSNNYLPRLTITDANLTNPLNSKEKFHINKFEIVISPASIWNLSVIFDQININGTELIFEHQANGVFTINGLEISQKQKANKKTIDLEDAILKQKNIHLSHINLIYLDNKLNLPKINLPDIDISFNNSFNQKHNINMSIGNLNESNDQFMTLKLNWQGNKFSEIKNWKTANLKIQTYRKSNNVINKITQYLPGSDFFNDLNAQTAIEANLQNGQLINCYANFNIRNIHYFLQKTQNEINLPYITGIIDLHLINNSTYSIKVSNLSISSTEGTIITNQQINGKYIINQKGNLSLNDTKLSGFNQLLKILPNTKKISLDGTLDIMRFKWIGTVTNPKDYNIYLKFTNLGLTSLESKIPSINNISGDAIINKENGILNLNLKNTKMVYPSVFLIPYQFKNLTTKIEWHKNQESNLEVILNPTKLELIDFTGYAYGKYTSNESNIGYLSLRAHINKLATSKVGDYLPLQIPMSVHKWLNNGLIGGNAESADLILEGWLHDFPFVKNQTGKFYIDANVVDGKLNYVDKWPPLEHINGKFQIRNESIIIQTNDAYVYNNKINKAYVIIPDMTSHAVKLLADGEAYGATDNFMQYLSKTPINKIIGRIPDKTDAKGDGYLTLHLDIPFAAPMKTKVNGTYKFIDNNIKFDMPIPYLTNVNGILNYSEKGIAIKRIEAKTLNSEATLEATTDQKGILHFVVQSKNLDYNSTLQQYLPFLTPIINGRSATTIKFDITKKGLFLNATSKLNGVTILAPSPIGKTAEQDSALNLTLKPNQSKGFDIDYTLANIIYGITKLNENGSMDKTLINIGGPTLPNKMLNQPHLLINLTQPNTNLLDWFTTISNLISNKQKSNVAQTPIYNGKFSKSNQINNKIAIYPAEILVNTSIFDIGNLHLHNFISDILVLDNQVVFNLNSNLSNGYGTYKYESNIVNIHLNEFNILDVVQDKKESKTIESQLISPKLQANKHVVNTPNTPSKIPNINLNINDLYYENIRIADFKTNITQSGNDILIKNGKIHSTNTDTTFSGISYCSTCNNDQSFVEMVFNLNIKDLGQMLATIDQGLLVAKGNGNVVTKIQWDGTLKDFDPSRLIASINVDLKNGKFLKVSTGSIFGEILGIINLQSFTNFIHLNFSEAFANGFYFNTLKAKAYLLKNQLDIKSLYMAGPLAIVRSYGLIDLNNKKLDMYLIITPKLDTSIAIGAALVTINPFVGILTYIAQLALGEPFSKLFTFNYHVTGTIKKPKLTHVNISEQVISNLNTIIGNVDEPLK